MASLAMTRGGLPRTPRAPDVVAKRRGRLVHIVTIVVFATPFLLLVWYATEIHFISNFHASTVTKALLALDRGRLELIGLVYPPVPFLIAMASPSAWALGAASGLLAATIVWLLWRHLIDAGVALGVRLLLVGTLFMLPAFLFIATQSIGDVGTLLLFLLAWRSYERFMLSGQTVSGFMAGLVFGAGFFLNFHALSYGIVYAAISPLFLRSERQQDGHQPGRLAGALVIGFPVIAATVCWTYLNWLFTGRMFAFLIDPDAPARAFVDAEGTAFLGFSEALRSAGADLVHVPIYLVIGALVAIRSPRRFPAYLAPLVVVTVLRAIGFSYTQSFSVSTFAVAAIASAQVVRTHAAVLLVSLTCVLQIGLGLVLATGGAEADEWRDRVVDGRATSSDEMERAIADRLALVPERKILADDRSAFRLVARSGSAAPYVLPADRAFEPTLSAPGRFVDYVLVSENPAPGDEVAFQYGDAAPGGFRLTTRWPGWKLYEREGAPPLFGEDSPFDDIATP